jgi:hypothetical protein
MDQFSRRLGTALSNQRILRSLQQDSNSAYSQPQPRHSGQPWLHRHLRRQRHRFWSPKCLVLIQGSEWLLCTTYSLETFGSTRQPMIHIFLETTQNRSAESSFIQPVHHWRPSLFQKKLRSSGEFASIREQVIPQSHSLRSSNRPMPWICGQPVFNPFLSSS